MKLIAKLHKIDMDQVELFDEDMRWLFGVFHIDSFSEMPELIDALYAGDEVLLRLEAA